MDFLYIVIQVYSFVKSIKLCRSLHFFSIAMPMVVLLVLAAGTTVDFPGAYAAAADEAQAGPPIGIVASGTIDSIITTPTTRWIATGNWSMNVNNGSLQNFETNMTWLNSTGTAAHTHEFLNFRVEPEKVISLQQPGNNIFLEGVMDVGTNKRVVWRDVPANISINAKNTIIISVDDNTTNHHFAAQPVLGIVKSFVLCSDIPGPNMEVLPPCTSNIQKGANEELDNASASIPSSSPSSSTASTPKTAEVTNNATIRDITYKNATLGLKLDYPSNWVIQQGGSVSPTLAIVAILFPPGDNSSAFTIGIQDLGAKNGTTTIEDYANNTISRYEREVSNFHPTLLGTNGTLSGNPAYEIDGSYTNTDSKERELFEIGTLVNNKVYVFQFDSPKSLSSNYLPTVTNILQSIEINGTLVNNTPEAPTESITESSTPTKVPCHNITIDKVSASGFEKDPNDYNPPEHAIDNNSSTWWSNKKVPSWIMVELSESIQICSVDIAWNKGEERTYDFTLSTSSDGKSFEDVYSGKSSGTSSSNETYNLENSPQGTKFLKINLTGSSSKAGWVGIKDIRVIGHVIGQ